MVAGVYGNSMKKVNVVFCMDTEGPCDDPNNVELLHNWNLVDKAMDKLFTVDFRTKYPDSYGGHFKIGWFFLSWTGFKINPRWRDFGHHKVRDHYLERYGDFLKKYGDEECWHYHHPPTSGVGNEWGMEWNSSTEYNEIISRQIIERGWFPTCFRAGGTIMNSDLSQWLERWFPFDYSNRAPLNFKEMDWSNGVVDWYPYHPDPKYFKSEGNGRRYMSRCMDLETNLYTSDKKDIEQAFLEASLKGKSILSVFDHDYRDIEERILSFLSKLNLVSKKYDEISWQYSTPSDAIIDVTNDDSNNNLLKLKLTVSENKLNIEVEGDVYQEYPWVVFRGKNGSITQPKNEISNVSNNVWELIIEDNSGVELIAVAVSNDLGETAVEYMKL